MMGSPMQITSNDSRRGHQKTFECDEVSEGRSIKIKGIFLLDPQTGSNSRGTMKRSRY